MRAANSVAGVVLCGGRSLRMGGGDKCLLPLAGGSLLSGVVDRLRPQVSLLAINANGDPARFAAYDLAILADPMDGYPGPLAGVLAAMEWAALQAETDHVATVAGDTPFVPADMVARLSAALAGKPDHIAISASGGRLHPICALWPVTLRHGLRRAIVSDGIARVNSFVEARPHAVVAFEIDDAGDPFFNVNTADDLIEAQRRAGQAQA